MPAGAHTPFIETSREGGLSASVVPHSGVADHGFSRLAPLIQVALDEELQSLKSLITRAESELARELKNSRLITREKAAEFLALSLSQLDRLTKDGKIPVVCIDKRPRYSLTALREFCEARTLYPQIRGPYRPRKSSPANTKTWKQIEKDTKLDRGGASP